MIDPSAVTIRLSEQGFRLLREVLEKRAPEFLSIFREDLQVNIRREQRRQLQELIGDELIDTGLQENDEPNARGLDLENLIDALSPYK
ncbi:MAG: hypothetical protein U1E76_12795 [Planctomycetota bacterium]